MREVDPDYELPTACLSSLDDVFDGSLSIASSIADFTEAITCPVLNAGRRGERREEREER